MFSRFFSRLEENVIALLLVSTTLLVFVEVVLRFGFNTGLSWGEEATRLLAAWFVLFGVSWGVKIGAHIGVEVFVNAMPPTLRRFVSTIAVIASLVYCALILYGSWVYLSKMYKLDFPLEDLPIPTWVAHSILFIGFVLLSARLLILLWNIALGKAEGFKLADEAKESMHLAVNDKEGSPTP